MGLAGLVALQRTAGNRATARLLQQVAPPSSPAAPGPRGAAAVPAPAPVPVQRSLAVTVRTANPGPNDPLDKIRVSGRPEGFWAGTQRILGPRGAKQDYRHIVDFDTVKRGRAKELKKVAVAAADAAVQVAITAVTQRYGGHYVPPVARVVGVDPLRQLEDRVKHLLKLEFNDPGNLWLGPSGENRSGGSTGKQLKMGLKRGFRGSKHFNVKAASGDVGQKQLDHFAARLDFTPDGSKDDHYAQLAAFATAYGRGFAKSDKYGDATILTKQVWNDWYRPEWLRGQSDAAHGRPASRPSVPYAAGRTAKSGVKILQLTLSRVVQRSLAVTVRQTPRDTQPIEKVRIADRPGKFWTAVEQHLGARADKQDFRHVVDFDLIRSSWERKLKNLTLSQARQRVSARFRELSQQYPRGMMKSMKGFVHGGRKVPLLEQDLKQLMTLEFNNPSNLWVGDSAENRSRGSTARARKQTLKVSSPTSKYHKPHAALAGGQLSNAQREHFENRLDLALPTSQLLGKRWKEQHRQHLDRFTAFYEEAFSRKAAKYGASATLSTDFWNGYAPLWQQGYDDRLANTFDDASTHVAYRAGGLDAQAEFSRGYKTYRMQLKDPNPAYTRGRLAAWTRFDRGFTDAQKGAKSASNAEAYTAGYAHGLSELGHADGLAGRPRAAAGVAYLRGYAAGERERALAPTGGMKRAATGHLKHQPPTKKRS